MVDQNAPEGGRDDGEEMRAAAPFGRVAAPQPQIDFIDQRGRLQGVACPLRTQQVGRHTVQFGIETGDYAAGAVRIAFFPVFQELGDGKFAGRWRFVAQNE